MRHPFSRQSGNVTQTSRAPQKVFGPQEGSLLSHLPLLERSGLYRLCVVSDAFVSLGTTRLLEQLGKHTSVS